MQSEEEKMNHSKLIEDMGKAARSASRKAALLSPSQKNTALEAIAKALRDSSERIKQENQKDLKKAPDYGLTEAMIDRLELSDERIDSMATAVEEIAALPDPVGAIEEVKTRPNGLRIGQMRAPIGVIGIIYESRPNVTADAGALCLKSGNAVILRGGKEAFYSNSVIASVMNEAAADAGLPKNLVKLVPTIDREAVGALLQASDYVDLIIPRGGKSLIKRVTEDSHIPVIKHLDGNCSVYIDENADLDLGVKIIVNSKTQRTGVCNAAETLLVHKAVAQDFLPKASRALIDKGVELRGCPITCELVPEAIKATEQDWYEEYLDLILAVKVVQDYEEAVDFINQYGSHHTESIVTKDHQKAMNFLSAVDSSCVHINASTRFSDGGEYGLGAEIGISTDKLHARGPMGLKELTTLKWIVFGEGQIRE